MVKTLDFKSGKQGSNPCHRSKEENKHASAFYFVSTTDMDRLATIVELEKTLKVHSANVSLLKDEFQKRIDALEEDTLKRVAFILNVRTNEHEGTK